MYRLIAPLTLTLVASAPACAQGFDETTVMAYCTSTKGPDNFDIWWCRDHYKKDFDIFERLPSGQPSAVTGILGPALAACRNEWFPQWDMVRHCGERQLSAAIRYAALVVDSMHTRLAYDYCLDRHGDDLNVAAICYRQALKIIND